MVKQQQLQTPRQDGIKISSLPHSTRLPESLNGAVDPANQCVNSFNSQSANQFQTETMHY
jgi:hypothetical protein